MMNNEDAKFQKNYAEDGEWQNGGSPAHTLAPEVGLVKGGWVVDAEIKEDYYLWINDFVAVHPDHGRVWGDFELIVYATSEAGFEDFVRHNPPSAWDYWDI